MRPVLALLALAPAVPAWADSGPAFDRPGIGFDTGVLEAGGLVWEQGLPDASLDRAGGERADRFVAASLLRVGLGGGLELQLGTDSYAWQQRQQGQRTHGGGDSRIGLKAALPSPVEGFGWALLGTYTEPTARAPLSQGRSRELGITASWELPQGRSVALYADYARDSDDHAWTFSPSYTFHAGPRFSSYVEAGVGLGGDAQRVAGAGGLWRIAPAVQLDLWFLRGLTTSSTDWQGGFGIAFALR